MHHHIFARHPIPAGGLLALATVPIHAIVPLAWSQSLAAGILALIGGVYIGFAALDGRSGQLALEGVVGVGFAIFSMAALEIEPWWLPVGYVAHGLWDAAHHSRLFDVTMPRWYILACAVYDIVAGLGLLAVWALVHA